LANLNLQIDAQEGAVTKVKVRLLLPNSHHSILQPPAVPSL
jgi:hypothetical protein